MTLTELFEALTQQGTIPAHRAKDLKTSLRYLARALNTTPEQLINAEILESRYQTTVRTYFTTLTPAPSRHTIRNTLNNLSFFFRMARTCGLLHVPPPTASRLKMNRALENQVASTSPYRNRDSLKKKPYCQPVVAWPDDILNGWTHYQSTRQFDLRPISLQIYESRLRSYVGYLTIIEQPSITTWNQLFDPQHLKRFLQWHAKRVGASRITTLGIHVAAIVRMIAKHQERPEYPLLKAFIQKLPTPTPMHDKQRPEHSLTLQELEQAGLTLLEEARTTIPHPHSRHPGARATVKHGKALMLRLLVRVPLRQRNIRELQLRHNLYRDQHGIWQLQFQGDDLKIGQRGGRINTFHLPFPPDLVQHLEEYLQHYRPRVHGAAESEHLFLNWQGDPYTKDSLAHTLLMQIYARTGKRFYPHLIRTIWTDTYLLHTGDVSTAAYMLNDRPETVLKRYHELRANDHIQKAYQFTGSLLGAQ